MNIYTVRNSEGDTTQVEEDKLNHAIKDGYIPVVSNGKEEVRTLPENFQKAAADGFSPILIKPEPTKTESFVRGLAQGGSLGFADELAGVVGAISDVAGDKYQLSDLLSRYKAQRDESREAYRKAEEANPLTSIAGNIAGGAATALIPGLGQANLASAVKVGAATGLGAAEGDTVGEQVKSAGIGAGLGVAGYGLGKALGAASDLYQTSEMGKLVKTGLEEVGEKQNVNLALPQQAIDASGKAFGPKGIKEAKQLVKEAPEQILSPIQNFLSGLAKEQKNILDTAKPELARSPLDFSKDAKDILKNIFNVTGVEDINDPEIKKILDLAQKMRQPSFLQEDELGNLVLKPGEIKSNASLFNRLKQEIYDLGERAKDANNSRVAKAARELYELADQYTIQSLDDVSAKKYKEINKALSSGFKMDELLSLDKGTTASSSIKDQSKIVGILDKLESTSASGITSQLKTDELINLLRQINPELAKKTEETIRNKAALASGVKSAEIKGIDLGVINKSIPVKIASAIGSNKTYQNVKKLATKSSDYYNKIADTLLTQKGNEAISNVFKKMATADNNTRNALLFGLYQNPSFRQTMDQLASSEE